MHLGDYPAVSLHGARALALGMQTRAGDGEDPRKAKTAQDVHQTKSLEWLIDKYLEEYAKPRLASAQIGAWVMKRHWRQAFGKQAFSTLTRSDLNKRLLKIARSQDHGPGAALEARRWIMGVFSWAIKAEIATVNPAVGLYGRDDLRQSPADLRPRDRVLTISEARAVYRAALRMPDPWGDLARILLLTLARLGEFAKAENGWFDRYGQNLEIPGVSHKNGDPKTIPLTPLTAAILGGRPDGADGPFLFSTTKGGKPVASYADAYANRLRALTADELKLAPPHFTIHDFRRTGATHLTAMGVNEEVVEMLLGHRIRGVRGVYMKHKFLEERREALRRWEEVLTSTG